MKGTNFRIYADGEIVHEDDFEGMDYCPEGATPSDFMLCFIPDELFDYIRKMEDNPKCSFCNKTKKEVGTPVIKGKDANICYGCIATNKKKLDKEEEKK